MSVARSPRDARGNFGTTERTGCAPSPDSAPIRRTVIVHRGQDASLTTGIRFRNMLRTVDPLWKCRYRPTAANRSPHLPNFNFRLCQPQTQNGLTSPRESVDSQPDGRSLRVDLECYSRAIPVADGIASSNPYSWPPTQYAAPQIAEAGSPQQCRSPCVCWALSFGSQSTGRADDPAPRWFPSILTLEIRTLRGPAKIPAHVRKRLRIMLLRCSIFY